MKVLITGGAGFIGSSLALHLISRGHSVRVLDNLSPQIHGDVADNSPTYQEILGKVDFIKGDVRNRADWEKALPQMECVVHLAAETGTGQSMYEVHHYMDVNIGGTAHLIDLLDAQGKDIKRMIIASSRAIYGEGRYVDSDSKIHFPSGRNESDLVSGIFNPTHNGVELQSAPTKEEDPFAPTSFYGLSKQVQEQMILMAAQTKGISAFALRYQNVYGPGQSLKNPYTGIISIFSKLLLANKPINIFEDGEESRDFVFIDDVISATRMAIEFDGNSTIDSLNVGHGVATSVNQVAQTLKRLYNSSSELNISGNYRIGDIRHNTADLSRARSLFGYAPQTDVEKGLGLFASWVKTQQLADDNSYENSILELRDKGLFK